MPAQHADPIAHEKAVLRRRFRAFRAGLDEAEYRARSMAVVAQARTVPELQRAETVHVYWPLVRRREIDVRPLIGWLQAAGKQIVLPVVDTATDAPRLRHARFETAATLHPNQWGVHEPIGGQSVPLETLDAVVVPALGAGRNGHRVGYGKGYYDAFLHALAVPTVGLVFAACLVDQAPAAPHDVPLDILITEDEIIRVGQGVTSSPPPP